MRPSCSCHDEPMIRCGSGRFRCRVRLAEWRDTDEFRAKERRRNGRREVQRRKARMAEKERQIETVITDLLFNITRRYNAPH